MSILIEKAGLHDTVQDAGRYGYGHWGVNTNGPMDPYAFALANALLGNELNAPVLEVHFPAPIIRFQQPALIALTGANFSAMLDGEPLLTNRAYQVAAGAVLRFAHKKQGERCYLAVRHGWLVPQVMGSAATNLKSGFGGYQGRALKAGDSLPVKLYLPERCNSKKMPWFVPDFVPENTTELPVLKGPEWEWLQEDARYQLQRSRFEVSRKADRTGIHWLGTVLQLKASCSMVSSPVIMGATQLLPSGQLLTLMADHQTVGGYPRVLQLCKVALPILAQSSAGMSFGFLVYYSC
jgi:Allophanate hydrolase subunit 2